MLKKNKKAPARHKADDDYLLTLKLFCGKCGGIMVGESGHSGNKKNVHHYYKCQNNKRYKTCDRKAIRKNSIEDVIVEEAMKTLNDDKLLKVITDSVYEAQKEENVRLPALQAQLVETEKKLENVMNAIEQGIILSTTKDRLLQLENEKKELSTLIAQEQIKAPFLTKNQIMFFFKNLRKTNIKTKEGKQALIDVLIKTVFVYDDKLLITFNYKDSARTVSLSEAKACSDNRNAREPTKSTIQTHRAFLYYQINIERRHDAVNLIWGPRKMKCIFWGRNARSSVRVGQGEPKKSTIQKHRAFLYYQINIERRHDAVNRYGVPEK